RWEGAATVLWTASSTRTTGSRSPSATPSTSAPSSQPWCWRRRGREGFFALEGALHSPLAGSRRPFSCTRSARTYDGFEERAQDLLVRQADVLEDDVVREPHGSAPRVHLPDAVLLHRDLVHLVPRRDPLQAQR